MRLELRGVTKRFGSLVANDHIDLDVLPGQIHALLGENGAGKTTLMNVLYGLYHPDEGSIVIDGVPRQFHGPGDAIAAGIGMVHQHFMLVPVFTVAENVMLGTERTRLFGWLDQRAARREVKELSERYGLDVPVDAVVEDLPVGVQQRVEIIKALRREAQVLILDEPTAVLTPQEIDDLLVVLRGLREGGKSIVFITHKLKEVQRIADTITVIRRGKVVGSARPDASEAELATLMVGRSVELRVTKEPAAPGEVILRVTDLSVVDERGQRVLDDVSFDVSAGEILAVAGVQGNGQTELVEALTGLQPALSGSILVDRHELLGRSPREVIDAGVGHVPEDRQVDGLVGDFSVAENLVLNGYQRAPYASGLALKPTVIRNAATRLVGEFDIRTSSIDTPASTLSGGNQQKVVLARELSRPLRLLIASQPTRGLDVGSIEFVHRRVIQARDQGTAVLIVSSELDEVLALADRIAVMFRGRIIGIVPGDTSRDEIGLMMAGASGAPGDGDAAPGDSHPAGGPDQEAQQP